MAKAPRVNRRDEIVRAAYRVLSEVGYEAASIKEIARAIDIAPGLIHYYFATKEELLVAVVEHASTVSRAQFRSLWDGGKQAGAGLATAAFDMSLSGLKERSHDHRLRFELFAVGLYNPAVRAAMARVLRARRENMTGIVRAVDGNEKAPTEALAALIAAVIDGLAIQTLADDTFDPAPAFRLLGEMTRGLGASRRKRRKGRRGRSAP